MRTITTRRGMLVGLAVLAAAGMTACSVNGTPSVAGPGTRQTTTSQAAAAPSATTATSPPVAAPSATPTARGGAQNLVITSAEKSQLTAVFVAVKGIPLSDVAGAGPIQGSVYYAYDPATDTYWALADFEPSSTASLNVKVSFQDGDGTGMFRKTGAGAWQVQLGEVPVICVQVKYFPLEVLAAWSMPTSVPSGINC